jgi:hypothetical protein
MYRDGGLVPSRRGFFFQAPPAEALDSARAFYYGKQG